MSVEQIWIEFDLKTPAVDLRFGERWFWIEVSDEERRTRWRFWWSNGHDKPQMTDRVAFFLYLSLYFGAKVRVAFRYDPSAPIPPGSGTTPILDIGGVEATFPDGRRYEIVDPP